MQPQTIKMQSQLSLEKELAHELNYENKHFNLNYGHKDN